MTLHSQDSLQALTRRTAVVTTVDGLLEISSVAAAASSVGNLGLHLRRCRLSSSMQQQQQQVIASTSATYPSVFWRLRRSEKQRLAASLSGTRQRRRSMTTAHSRMMAMVSTTAARRTESTVARRSLDSAERSIRATPADDAVSLSTSRTSTRSMPTVDNEGWPPSVALTSRENSPDRKWIRSMTAVR